MNNLLPRNLKTYGQLKLDICIYLYICICKCVYIYICIHTQLTQEEIENVQVNLLSALILHMHSLSQNPSDPGLLLKFQGIHKPYYIQTIMETVEEGKLSNSFYGGSKPLKWTQHKKKISFLLNLCMIIATNILNK